MACPPLTHDPRIRVFGGTVKQFCSKSWSSLSSHLHEVVSSAKSQALGLDVEAGKKQFTSSSCVSKSPQIPLSQTNPLFPVCGALPTVSSCQVACATPIAIANVHFIAPPLLVDSEGVGSRPFTRSRDAATADALHPRGLDTWEFHHCPLTSRGWPLVGSVQEPRK